MVNSFIPSGDNQKNNYRRIFYAFQVTVFGMLLFFPFQGYSLTTIVFSSAFILISYLFAFRFLKDTASLTIKNKTSLRFARTAIWFLLLSSIGPWSLGPLSASGLGGSDLYFNMIYYYLHFLYNGWFLFAIMALLFSYLEKSGLSFNIIHANRAWILISTSTLASYVLSLLWVEPPYWVYIIGILAVVIQLMAVGYLIGIFRKVWNAICFPSKFYKWLAVLIIGASSLKILLQTLSAFPHIAAVIAVNRDWILAYLHLVFLGIVSPFILVNYYWQYHCGSLNIIAKAGLIVFVFGFLTHEVLMFLRGGAFLPTGSMSAYLLASTILILLGVICLVTDYATNKSKGAKI